MSLQTSALLLIKSLLSIPSKMAQVTPTGKAPRQSDSPVAGLAASPTRALTVVRPSTGWAPLNTGELWKHRELLYFLTWRDIKVRYKQTALGATWAVIQPFLTMVVFTVFSAARET